MATKIKPDVHIVEIEGQFRNVNCGAGGRKCTFSVCGSVCVSKWYDLAAKIGGTNSSNKGRLTKLQLSTSESNYGDEHCSRSYGAPTDNINQ